MSVVTKKRHQPLRGSKGGSSKPKQPHIAQNGVASLSTARIVYLLKLGADCWSSQWAQVDQA